MKKFLLAAFLFPSVLFAQSNAGELRLKVSDPAGFGVRSSVELVSEANQFHKILITDEGGKLTAERLPFGVYRIQIAREGFAAFSDSIEIRSAVPSELRVTLHIAAPNESVTVQDEGTLVDPHATGIVNRIGADTIGNRPTSLPGRSLQDLVNSQPGWLYEGNAVLHPRGSEYQTQLVVDGIPLTDDRSPSFGPEIEADDVQSMSIYTAGIPAEYGRKMGGVVEIDTAPDARQGLHGEAVLSGGSFDTAGASAMAQYVWGKNTLVGSAAGNTSDHYLNPVVIQNYTNSGTTGDFSLSYSRELTNHDRFSASVRHEFSRFLVPNEQLQQAAGQRQYRDNFETMGIADYEHIFSPNVLADFRGMVRDNSNDLSSNPLATPIIAFQSNSFREGYFKGTVSIHRGKQEWKAGAESDATFLHERFNDVITNAAQYDPGTPLSFSFLGQRPDLEQSAFVQDLVRLGNWTLSAGLRWDHYQLLLNQNAVSPRLAVSRYFPAATLVLHASYDRIFQTPDFENILLSSSPEVVALNPNVLRLPVQPSHGNYYELGMTKGFRGQLSLDANTFIRAVSNYADDDQLLNTGVSFPIAFRRARLYGAEAKLNLPHWGRLSGFLSYSYIVGTVYLPVNGGLFLGDDATQALGQTSGRFFDSQDQRNTVRARFRYELTQRLWVAAGGDYGSGLPFEFDGTLQQALAEYGPQIVDRVNFDTGRVNPSLSINASAGADLWKHDNATLRLQADVENINNRLNVIDFGGLFSGNAIAPPRSYWLRLTTEF